MVIIGIKIQKHLVVKHEYCPGTGSGALWHDAHAKSIEVRKRRHHGQSE